MKRFKTVFLLIIITIGLLGITGCEPTVHTETSTVGCCSITTQYFPYTGSYLVTWTDHTTGNDSYSELVEVEYPDADLTPEQELELELEWTVSEFKDFCHTSH